jgi:hypothetical protein
MCSAIIRFGVFSTCIRISSHWSRRPRITTKLEVIWLSFSLIAVAAALMNSTSLKYSMSLSLALCANPARTKLASILTVFSSSYKPLMNRFRETICRTTSAQTSVPPPLIRFDSRKYAFVRLNGSSHFRALFIASRKPLSRKRCSMLVDCLSTAQTIFSAWQTVSSRRLVMWSATRQVISSS